MGDIVQRVLHTNIYIQPIHFFLVIVTNILNIRILCSRILLSSPCTYYFLVYAVLSIIYTCLLCPIQFLRAFSINWMSGSVACRMHTYFLFLLPLQANIMLVLASFDRYCSSSQARRLQSKIAFQIARRKIILGIVFCVFYMLPILFIYQWDLVVKRCLLKFHVLINIYVLSQVMTYYVISPTMMVLFGILTINRIHQNSIHRILLLSTMRQRRTEIQLARMLIIQVAVHLVLVVPFGIMYSVNSMIPSTQTPHVIAIRLLFVTWQQCDYFASFFLYTLSASIYRQQLIRILKASLCFNTRPRYFSRSTNNRYQDVYDVRIPVHNSNKISESWV